MRYRLKIAWRYLLSNPAQSLLLIFGVSLGVFVFVFMSALIGGLAVFLTDRTVGNIAHVTLDVPDLAPAVLYGPPDQLSVAQEPSASREKLVRNPSQIAEVVAEFPGIAALSGQIVGNGFATRGSIVKPVSVIGVAPEEVSAIADVSGHITQGNALLPIGSALIGTKLAEELAVSVGHQLRLTSDQQVDRSLSITGIFDFGSDILDERAVYVHLRTARGLFGITQGVNRVEIKLDDLWTAPEVAARLGPATGLKATPWTASNAQLLSGLDAQGRSGTIIKSFALLTIVIGVASALLLSTYRRQQEIGIMRAMGAPRSFVVAVFFVQGVLIGLSGALLGAALAWLALSPFPTPQQTLQGSLPIDVRQGGFVWAIVLTVAGAALAAILPARSAAKVDPVEVINQ